MFERLSQDTREVLVRAQEHARRLGHGWAGCEHLLLGVAESTTPAGALLRDAGRPPRRARGGDRRGDRDGTGRRRRQGALATLGIDLDQVQIAAETTFGPGALDAAGARVRRRRWGRLRRGTRCATATGKRPFTPKAKRCLELSLREALRLQDGHVGVEHVALALLAREDTAAWKVLLHVGVVPAELRQAVEQVHRRSA